jgi:hypothetical protein
MYQMFIVSIGITRFFIDVYCVMKVCHDPDTKMRIAIKSAPRLVLWRKSKDQERATCGGLLP